MSFTKHDATRLYKKLRRLEPNVSGALGTPPSGSAVGAVGDVVLAASPATTTDVLDARITATTFMELAPADLYGSAEKGAGNIFWSSPSDGIMRITHTASTKTRTFKYLLMFALALLLAGGAFAQVIEEDDVPLEVEPALNFGPGILCASGTGQIDCDIYGVGAGGDVMLASEWATIVGPFVVDYADTATGIDADRDGIIEIGDVPGVSIAFDVNEDGTSELSGTPTTVEIFGGGADAVVIGSTGQTIIGHGTLARMGSGIGVGNGTSGASSASVGNSSCSGREAATDRLFADRNCDYDSVQTRQTNTAGTERYLENDNELLRLTADYDNATTTGTEITGLQVSVNGARTYDVTYHLLVQSTSASFATTGIEFGVNYTNGTPAPFICLRTVPTDDAAGIAATGLEEDVHVGGTTGKSFEFWETQTETTTAVDMGPTAGFLTQTATVLEQIHCILTTASGAGDIELWAASSGANNVRVKAQSWVNVITVQ